MKESEFIKQNKEKWQEFENNLLKKEGDPSKTSKLFIQITDDLSYARTFYQNRSVRLYLNGSAKILFNDLNKTKKRGFQLLARFLKEDLPLAMYQARRPMLISFCVFLACFVLGIITSIQDKDFAKQILSVSYVDMTEQNIEKGDAMAVYKSQDELRTFFPILYNNLRVDFITFFSGIFMAIGTLVVMVSNGVMVGVFQYFFIERGLFWESFLGIWTHGALEIPAIIISGGAGMCLGKGLLFPGTYSRFQAFKISGMLGLKIIMGVIPVTVLAAFIEGFLTRHTDLPNSLRFLFIVLSFASVLFYFVFYPRRVAKRHPNPDESEKHILVYKPEIAFDPGEIYSTGKLITETFRHLFAQFSFFAKWIILLPIAFAVLITSNPLSLFYEHENYTFGLSHFFNYENYPLLGFLTAFAMGILTPLFVAWIKQRLGVASDTKSQDSLLSLKNTMSGMLLSFLFVFIIYTGVDFTLALANILFPWMIFILVVAVFEDVNLLEAINRAFNLLNHSWQRFIGTAVFFVAISLALYATVMYGLSLLMMRDALSWMVTDDEAFAEKLSVGLSVFQSYFSFFLYLALLAVSFSLLYFTLKEIGTAGDLLSRIKNTKFGSEKK